MNRINVALLENDVLCEFLSESDREAKITGNIYKGIVMNVLPGMQAAFVNVGLSRNGYLSAGDIMVDKTELQNAEDGLLLPGLNAIREGDYIMCQAVKDESGAKGARLTQNVTLPGRYIVLMPTVRYVGISRKIDDEKTRERLMTIVKGALPEGYGAIVRTAAREASKKDLTAEIAFLYGKWEKIKASYAGFTGRGLIYSEGDLAYRAIRDLLCDEVEQIIVNEKAVFDSIKRQLESSGLSAKYAKRMTLFGADKGDIFIAYKIWSEVDKLISRRVDLKNGAYLIIDKTEAMTVIDVNTGRFIGDTSLEQTVFEANMSAAEEIVRQLRLRNIGGIIIIDFIDMRLQEHNYQIVEYLKSCLKSDRVKNQVVGMTPLGLVEMTRKKTTKDISSVIAEPCGYCEGEGSLYSARYIIGKMQTAIQKLIDEVNPSSLILTVSNQLLDAIFSSKLLNYHCEHTWKDKRIYIVPDEKIHKHNYRIRMENRAVLDLPNNAMLLY